MAITLAEAFVKLRPQADRFGADTKTALEQQAGSAGKQVGATFGKAMVAGIGAVFAAGAVIDFFKGAINEATEAAKVGRLTEQVIRSTGAAAKVSASQVGDLAESLSELSGVDDEVIQSGANVLLTFTNIRNEVGKGNNIFDQAVASALDLSAALGQDMQSSVVQLGKALNDPIKGVTALQRVGVSFTESQRDQIRAMVDAGHVMDAQKLILAELTKEFGGAAEAAATPADKARVAWGNFQEMIGEKLLPVLNDLLQFGLANQDWLVPLATSIGSLAVVIGTVVVAQKAWDAVQSVLSIGVDSLTAKTKRAAIAITSLAVASTAINEAFPGYQTDVEGLADSLRHLGETGEVSGELTRIFGKDLKGLQEDANLAKSSFGGVGRALESLTPGLKQLNEAAGNTSFSEAADNFRNMDEQLAQMARSGHAEAARASYVHIMQAAHLTADEMERLTPKYNNAIREVERSTGQLASTTDEAANAGESLLDVWKSLHGEMVSADEAMLDAQQSIEDIKRTFEDGTKSVQGNTLAQLENRVALEHAAEAAAEAAQAYLDNGGSADGARQIMDRFRDSAVKATGATGKQADEVRRLAEQLFQLPDRKTVLVQFLAQGLDAIAAKLKALFQGAMGKLGFAEGGILSFAGGGIAHYATGGLENHVAQIVKAGMVRVWGEPETGGEAYIPLSPAKRARSTQILAEVARRFGYGLVGEVSGMVPVGSAPDAGGQLAGLLQLLIAEVRRNTEAVNRVAPGVGRELNGSADIMHQLARAW